MNNEITAKSRDLLISGLKTMVEDVEEVAKDQAEQASNRARSAQVKFKSSLRDVKKNVNAWGNKSRDVFQTTGQYVQQNPWQSVAVGALAGLMAGIILGRK